LCIRGNTLLVHSYAGRVTSERGTVDEDECLQIEALPNFAMTDYASQGKTRQYNVVDLTYSRSHQGYYTALSRSSSAAGTLILSSFHPSKITGGASGALRQEFRELELLDNIMAPYCAVSRTQGDGLYTFYHAQCDKVE